MARFPDQVAFGPSPRVRGTLAQLAEQGAVNSVHPRVCGEHGVTARVWRDGNGPSPRVRGTLHQLG